MRRRELQAAIDARIASAAKVMRLEQETRARQELLEGVVAARIESARRRREQKAAEAKEKTAAGLPPANAPRKADPPEEIEYGGG